MTWARIFALVALVTGSAALSAKKVDPALVVGHWSGQGTFRDLAFQRQHGTLPFNLVIGPDHRLSGTVGGATIQPCLMKKGGSRLAFHALLSGQVRPENAFRKNRLALLITQTQEGWFKADFQLKSSAAFDPSMRQGWVEVAKTPAR
jgi:hypothetical protein